MIFLKKEEFLVIDCPSLVAVTMEPLTSDTMYGSLLYRGVSFSRLGCWQSTVSPGVSVLGLT